VKNNKKIKKKS